MAFVASTGGRWLVLLAIYLVQCSPPVPSWDSNCRAENGDPTALCSHEELVDYCRIAEFCDARGAAKRNTGGARPPVDLTLYYEARCPFSIFFIMRNLAPAFTKLQSIMDVDLVPYGYVSREDVNGTTLYTCQHGPAECHGNRLHACAMDVLDVASYVPYLGCMAPRGSTDASAKSCAKGTKIDPEQIIKCAHGDKGERLFQKMAAKTEKLQPKFETLPWVLFNGALDYCQEHRSSVIQDGSRRTAASSDDGVVVVALYYESLCSGCHYMFKQSILPAYQRLNASGIVQFQIIPYGNAREKRVGDQWQFTCQHGAAECLGNLVETCALQVLGGIHHALPFVYCVEMQTFTIFTTEDVDKVAKTCAEQHGVPLDRINQCAQGAQGNALEHKMAAMTDALDPQHTFVPWITVNGHHTDAIQKQAWGNMVKLICDAYTGTKPSACAQPEPVVCNRNS